MTIHTWPGANVIGRPDGVVKVVPWVSDGRDQRAGYALPSREHRRGTGADRLNQRV